jgi:hypothetical protein
MKSMKNYENVFLDSVTRLLVSIAMFQRSCQELVQDLPDTEVRELIDLRTGWDNEQLRGKLKLQLKGNFGIYMLSVRQLNKRIDLLRKKLKLREDLTVSQPLNSITLHHLLAYTTYRSHLSSGMLLMRSFARSFSRNRGRVFAAASTLKSTNNSSRKFVTTSINSATSQKAPSRSKKLHVSNHLRRYRPTGLICEVTPMACTML